VVVTGSHRSVAELGAWAHWSRIRLVEAVGAGGAGAIVLVMLVSMAFGVATKAPCLSPWSHGMQPRWCYSDIAALFGERRLGMHVFPYVHGNYAMSGTGSVFMTPGEVEYPVLTGIFSWLAALPAQSARGFLIANIVMLIPFGVLASWLLWRMAGRRALLFAGAPAVAFYSFLNWDLLGVACAIAGIYYWSRRKPLMAASAFAVGGCFKLWPAFFLLPLIAESLAAGHFRRAVRAGLAGLGTAALLNAPFAVMNPRGWYAPFAFQANWPEALQTNSLWYWENSWISAHGVDLLSTTAVVAGFVVLALAAWRRVLHGEEFPFLQVCALMVAWYLIAGKVYSPQYDLWLLPFFALLKIKRNVLVQFLCADGVIYFWWLVYPERLSALLYLVVLWRVALLVWAMASAWRAEPARHVRAESGAGWFGGRDKAEGLVTA
jgi:hypothetical protein